MWYFVFLSPELMCSLATEAQLNTALNLPEDGHIEDSVFSWTSDHQNIDMTQSVEDSNNVCENLIIQIWTSFLKSTNLEEISQPSPIDDNLSDENSSKNVNENIIRDTKSFEVGIHEPFTINSTEATYVNTSLNLPQNDQVESPNRRELRKRAAESLIIQGERMKSVQEDQTG